jgi:hypothetical protein
MAGRCVGTLRHFIRVGGIIKYVLRRIGAYVESEVTSDAIIYLGSFLSDVVYIIINLFPIRCCLHYRRVFHCLLFTL